MRWIAKAYYWLAERLYHELAWAYDPASWLVSLGKWPTWRREVLPFIAGRRVLEIGFGTGELLCELARRGFAVYGLDRSVAMQNITAGKLRRHDLSWIPRVCGTAQRLPFPPDCFDTVIATFPSQYIYDPGTLSEVSRVLHASKTESGIPGGRFIVVGLTINQEGKSLGGIPVHHLLEPDDQELSTARWEIQITRPSRSGFNLPVFILTKQTTEQVQRTSEL